MRAIEAGGLYFLMAFAAGWVFGPIRELFLTPRIGPVGAVLVEAPFMLSAVVLSAIWIIRHRRIPARFQDRAMMGLIAFVLLIGAEFITTIGLRGLTVAAYLAHFATAFGFISLALYLIFAVLPLVVEQRTTTLNVPGR